MDSGWQTIGGKTYYFNPENNMSVRWSQTIDGNRYYFDKNSVMQTGWITWKDGTSSYFAKSGVIVLGTQTIDGVSYKFGTSGKAEVDMVKAQIAKKAQGYSSSTKYLILTTTSKNKVAVFYGSKGNWVLKKYYSCTDGANSSPTVKGTFKVGAKGLSFGEQKGYSCWYYTQFYGNYLFHSVLYYPYSKTKVMDGRLGISASHGCIRLAIQNAKWIYDTVPKNTTVVVY